MSSTRATLPASSLAGTSAPASSRISYRLAAIFLILALLAGRVAYDQRHHTALWVLDRLGVRLNVHDLGKSRYAAGPARNNGKCEIRQGPNGCEDMKLHEKSRSVFMSCGDPVERSFFFPPAGRFVEEKRTGFQESFYKYNLDTREIVELSIPGYEDDLILHGMTIWEFEDDPTMIRLFAINHARAGEMISVFDHALNSSTLTFVRHIRHPRISTPNSLAAAGPSGFFASNDRYFYGNPMREIEKSLGPFRWSGNVIYCDISRPKVDCRTVSPAVSFANGLLLTDEGRTLLMADTNEGTVSVFKVDASMLLTLERKINIGSSPDNIVEDPKTGDALVAAFPDFDAFVDREHDSLNSSRLVPAAVLRLTKAKEWEPSLMYWDDGSVVSLLTTAVLDPKTKRMIAVGPAQYGFAVCEVE